MPSRRYLQSCESERLAYSGAILPHGSLLAVDEQGRIVALAENIGTFLGGTPQDWWQQPLPEILQPLLSQVLHHPAGRLFQHGVWLSEQGCVDVHVFRPAAGDMTLLELLPCAPPQRPCTEPLRVAASAADDLLPQAALSQLVEEIACLSGFDRVMYYSFRSDEDGEVLAEARRESVAGSYFGLRFPASDVPAIARLLYVQNPWRLIPAASACPVPVLGMSAQALDLSLACLRSVSPLHQTYLANMGVAASFSLPVVINGRLAALLSAHHTTPRYLEVDTLTRANQRLRTFVGQVQERQALYRSRLLGNWDSSFGTLQAILQGRNVSTVWAQFAAWLGQMFACDGVVGCWHTERRTWGAWPLEGAALDYLDDWFGWACHEVVWQEDSLCRRFPDFPLSPVAGVLAIKLSLGEGDLRLYLSRQALVSEVAWGGNPDKPVEFHDGQLGIAPRRSFEKWVEKRIGYANAWAPESALLAMRLRTRLQKQFT